LRPKKLTDKDAMLDVSEDELSALADEALAEYRSGNI
jgi:hypothetical protein